MSNEPSTHPKNPERNPWLEPEDPNLIGITHLYIEPQTVKNIASSIRNVSTKVRDTVRDLIRSGAIQELALSIKEATIAARDTTKEIEELAKDMRDRGIISHTAIAIEEATIAARATGEAIKNAARQRPETVNETTNKVKVRTR
jgi:hypothetical protein